MENQNNKANAFQHKRQNEDKKFKGQRKIVFKAFYERPKTMLMVSHETGILRANICRYVAKWRQFNRIEPVRKDYCKITKHLASYLTTNPDQFPQSSQIKMF